MKRIASAAVAVVFLTACGSDSDGGGNGGTGNGGGPGNSGDRCGLEISLSGDVTYDSDLDDPITCFTAYTLTPGAYVSFGATTSGAEVGAIALRFPELDPGQTATSLALPLSVAHVDRTEFSPMGCTADVTDNSFGETTEGGDVYRVAGIGSCTAPGIVGERSVSVVGSFQFVAPIRWQN